MLAIDATERMLKLDPNAVLERLQVAKDDSALQEAMLYGILRYRGPDVLETVESIHQIGLSRPDSLALLVIARDKDVLNEDPAPSTGAHLHQGVSSPNRSRVQAAWLYLKHTDTLEDAMTHLVPEGP